MAELNVDVNVDVKGEQKLRGVGSSIAAGGVQVAKFATLAGGAIVAGGALLADLARDAEESQAKLESMFESSGAAAFTSLEALDKHAQAIAKATTFDDDAVKDAQSTLLSFGNIVGEQFTEATDVSADLAAFMGTELPDASRQLGKALATPEAAAAKLARMGIVLTDAQKDQIDAFVEAGDTAAAQGVILDALGSRFGNVAEDIAGTSSGKITNSWKQITEAGESIGLILLPVFATLAEGVKGFADFILANMPLIESVIGGVISTLSSVFSGAGGAVSGLSDLFAGLVAWVQENLPTIQSVAGQVFGAIGNVIKSVFPIIVEIAKVVLPALGAAASVAFKVLDVAFKGIGGAFEVMGNVIRTIVGVIVKVWGTVTDLFNLAVRIFERIGDTIFEPIGEGFGAAIDFIKGIWNAFARWWNSIEISVPSIDIPFVGKVGGFTLGLPDLPMLAEGGIITGPTLALLGEKGPEAVVPLDRTIGSGAEVNVFVQNDDRDLEKQIQSAISRMLWTQNIALAEDAA